jgi:hypothetical protein
VLLLILILLSNISLGTKSVGSDSRLLQENTLDQPIPEIIPENLPENIPEVLEAIPEE